MKKEHKFVKVVELYYPDGSIFEESIYSFYFMNIFVFIVGLLLSPLVWVYYFFENHKGIKKVYWKQDK